MAAAAALLPVPAPLVERFYSRGLYSLFQPYLTSVASLVPVALLDIGAAVLLVGFIAHYLRWTRRAGWRSAAIQSLLALLTTSAVIYLLFLASWGYNYRRVPLEAKLDFDHTRISREAAVRLAEQAIARLNAGHASAHAQHFRPDLLEATFASTHRMLGGDRPVRTAPAKHSLAGLYLRYAGFDGMTVPIFLEIILNPDLLPVEQPSVLAHEWAHLAGYADESEANFVAWIAGVRSEDPVAQYSAWLDAYRMTVNALPRAVRATLPPLDAGPRADLMAIAARYERASPAVRRVARGVYDSYLKANRIEEGIANYAVALQLMLGTNYEGEWRPRLR